MITIERSQRSPSAECAHSAHADYEEMVAWLRRSALAPKRVFVTHGEPAAADAMRQHLVDAFDWDVTIPSDGAIVDLAGPKQANE